jgi:hypothetical protein
MSAVVAAAAVAACSGGDDNGVEPTPTIDIALSQAALSIIQGGQNQTVTVTLTRGGGYAGAVNIAVEGAPTGVTVTPSPGSIAAGSTTSTITIAAAANATVGTATLTVRASGNGVTDKTQTIALTVEAAPAPSFTLAVDPTTRSIPQGGSGTVAVNITRTNGFAGAVALTAEGLPTGVTAAFDPQSATGNTSTLTLTVGAGAATGNSTITVRGASAGQTDKTATVTLTVTAAATGSYTLAVTPATVPVVQGGTGTANVAITRTGGFAGAVTLAATGLPNGVTAAFNPASPTGDASTLTLTAAAGAATGNATITVTGTADGQADKTATFALSVTAAGGFTLAVAPTSATVQQGGSQNATVTITRTGGFAGDVALAASGLPNGVTAAFNPQSTNGNTSTLTLTASASATVGQANVTITGTSAGVANQTATLALNVTATGGGSGNTTWEFCTTGDTPIWLAVQDGDGAWQRVNATGTKFQFNIASGRGGVAYVTQTSDAAISSRRTFAKKMSAAIETTLLMRNKAVEVRASRRGARYAARSLVDAFDLSIFYGTQTELNAQGTSQCLPGSGKTVNGSVANVGAGQVATVDLGGSFASVTGGQSNTFALEDVPDGALDLFATRGTLNQTTFQTTVDKLIIRRGVNAPANSTLPVLDFNAAEAFAPAQANISVGNLGGDLAFVLTAFYTANGTAGVDIANLFQTGAGPFPYFGVPTAQQVAGDLHLAIATAISQSADNARIAAIFFKDPTDRTVTLGSALPAPAVSVVSTTPYVRLRATGSVTSAYNSFVLVNFNQVAGGVPRDVTISATAGYLSNATTYDFTIPDFSGVPGWNNDWGLKTGAVTEWTVSGTGFSGIGLGQPNPVEGATFLSATRLGEITP